MTEDARETKRNSSPELGPVIARLEEIHRKCLSLGSRNDEAREMASRLESVITALSGGNGDLDVQPAFGDLARDLFPVARLFESLGFLSVARELAHVEKTLIDLEPDPSTGRAPAPGRGSSARVARASAAELNGDGESAPEPEDHPVKARGVPTPVVLGVVAVVIAIVASVLVVRRQQARHGTGFAVAVPVSSLPTQVLASPTPTHPTPATESVAVGVTPTPGPRARMASMVSDARLAQREGDIDRAISLLSQAALIDSKAHLVIDTARSLVADLLGRADGAAGAARWDEAAQNVERARELAIRFELATEPMDAAIRRHARLERYEPVDPTNITRIKQLAGNRAIVVTDDEAHHEGEVHDVVGGVLELHQGIKVGRGGTLFHIDRIPLAEVVEIRVYPD